MWRLHWRGNDQGFGDNISDPDRMLDSAKVGLFERIVSIKVPMNRNLITNANDQENAQEVIDALQQTLDTAELLENSDKNYRIEIKSNFDDDPIEANGEFSYDKNTGEYVISVEVKEPDESGSSGSHR